MRQSKLRFHCERWAHKNGTVRELMGVAIIASANFVGSNIFSGKKGNYPKKEFVFFWQKLRFLPKTGGVHTRGVAHEVVRSFGDTLRPIECTTCSLCAGTAVKNKYKQKTFAGPRSKGRLKIKKKKQTREYKTQTQRTIVVNSTKSPALFIGLATTKKSNSSSWDCMTLAFNAGYALPAPSALVSGASLLSTGPAYYERHEDTNAGPMAQTSFEKTCCHQRPDHNFRHAPTPSFDTRKLIKIYLPPPFVTVVFRNTPCVFEPRHTRKSIDTHTYTGRDFAV